MPISFHRLTQAILQDGDATKSEAQLIKRLTDAGDIERPELDSIIDMIEKSDIGHDKKKDALRFLTSYKEDTARGVESNLFGMDSALSSRLARQGVETCEDLLYVAAKPAGRFELADKINVEEKAVRGLVKQADLQRLDGVDPMLAKVMLDSGIDSVPELARRNSDSLHKTLKKFAGTRESWVMQFKCPSKDDVAAMVAQAKDLPRLVEFGNPLDSLATMGIEARAKLMINETGDLRSTSVDADTAADYLESKGLGALKGEMREHNIGVLESIASNLDYHGVDVSAEDLLDGNFTLPDNDDFYYEFDVHPSIEEFKDDSGNWVGTTFNWSTDDGSEGEYWHLAYDNLAGKFTAMSWSESANGDHDFTVFEDPSAPIDLPRLERVGAGIRESWGDENIQDGVATLKAEKADYGWGSPSSLSKSILKDYFEGDSDHRWEGWVSYHDDLPLTPSALDKAARSINNDGFQYANEGEVPRIRGEIESAVKELGDPDKITYGSASGKAIVEGVNNDEPVDCQIHFFVNRDNGAYVATISRGGSYN